MSTKWKLFEKTVKNIYELLEKNATITLDDKIFGIESETPRQIDISIKAKVAIHDILIIIECKDHNKKISVTEVEALKEKMKDVNADKAVLISKKGFYRPAINKAIKSGIDLCMIHDSESRDWKLDLKFPIVWEEYIPKLILNFSASLEKGDKISDKLIYEQLLSKNIINEFNSKWKKNLLPSEEGIHNYGLSNPPDYIITGKGDRRNIHEISVKYIVESCVYLGYVDDLPSSKGIKNLLKNEINLVFDIDDIINYKNETFIRFNSINEITVPIKNHLHILSKVEIYSGPFEPYQHGGINKVRYLGPK